MDTYDQEDATFLAQQVASGAASPDELLDDALARVAAFNPQLNAVVLLQEETARQAIKAGLPDGPFKGVPFLMKDLGAEAKDFPSHSGSNLLKDTHYTYDSAIYDRMRSTGVVTFGRTTSPEGGIGPGHRIRRLRRADAQSLEPVTYLWRVIRRVGRCGGSGHRADGARVRWWRVGAHPCVKLRLVRFQGHAGPFS